MDTGIALETIDERPPVGFNILKILGIEMPLHVRLGDLLDAGIVETDDGIGIPSLAAQAEFDRRTIGRRLEDHAQPLPASQILVVVVLVVRDIGLADRAGDRREGRRSTGRRGNHPDLGCRSEVLAGNLRFGDEFEELGAHRRLENDGIANRSLFAGEFALGSGFPFLAILAHLEGIGLDRAVGIAGARQIGEPGRQQILAHVDHHLVRMGRLLGAVLGMPNGRGIAIDGIGRRGLFGTGFLAAHRDDLPSLLRHRFGSRITGPGPDRQGRLPVASDLGPDIRGIPGTRLEAIDRLAHFAPGAIVAGDLQTGLAVLGGRHPDVRGTAIPKERLVVESRIAQEGTLAPDHILRLRFTLIKDVWDPRFRFQCHLAINHRDITNKNPTLIGQFIIMETGGFGGQCRQRPSALAALVAIMVEFLRAKLKRHAG